jgi:hypothetical protein
VKRRKSQIKQALTFIVFARLFLGQRVFLETLFLACFIELWPLNGTALTTSCGALGLC